MEIIDKSYIYYISFLIYFLIFFLINKYLDNINCQFKKNLNDYEINILTKYLKTEYETAHEYLRNSDIYHFFIIKNNVLISYFHIVDLDDDNNFYILYAYTNKDYRKKGYIKKLLNYSFKICKKNNINTIYYYTKIYNNASINTSKSLGFSVFEEKKDNIYFYKNL